MTKEKAQDILREVVSYIVKRGREVEGIEDFIKDTSDMEDYLLDNYFKVNN